MIRDELAKYPIKSEGNIGKVAEIPTEVPDFLNSQELFSYLCPKGRFFTVLFRSEIMWA